MTATSVQRARLGSAGGSLSAALSADCQLVGGAAKGEIGPTRSLHANRGHGHGGPLEIAAADAARPGTVDWQAAVDLDVITPPGGGVVQAINEGRPQPNWRGYHGRATEGSLEKGQRLLEIAAEQIVTLTQAWLAELNRPF